MLRNKLAENGKFLFFWGVKPWVLTQTDIENPEKIHFKHEKAIFWFTLIGPRKKWKAKEELKVKSLKLRYLLTWKMLYGVWSNICKKKPQKLKFLLWFWRLQDVNPADIFWFLTKMGLNSKRLQGASSKPVAVSNFKVLEL